jgi:hypothetical protein
MTLPPKPKREDFDVYKDNGHAWLSACLEYERACKERAIEALHLTEKALIVGSIPGAIQRITDALEEIAATEKRSEENV